ncbi:MAG: Hsp20/alpha crystallin family protein [Deltaproteobacteria bacterium]|nr:Hsp20/alpha crystallin family protein [Deltaproteobacteria bacterium]
MNLVRWNPWKETETFADRINRFLGGGSMLPAEWLSDESGIGTWSPAVDVVDQEDRILIKAELPGVDKKDIHVELKNNVLTLEGERREEKETKEERYYRKERFFGSFRRSFAVPEGLDPEAVKAEYKDGVLSVEIPKPEEKKTRKIAVH